MAASAQPAAYRGALVRRWRMATGAKPDRRLPR